jgi:hypothetical protein
MLSDLPNTLAKVPRSHILLFWMVLAICAAICDPQQHHAEPLTALPRAQSPKGISGMRSANLQNYALKSMDAVYDNLRTALYIGVQKVVKSIALPISSSHHDMKWY